MFGGPLMDASKAGEKGGGLGAGRERSVEHKIISFRTVPSARLNSLAFSLYIISLSLLPSPLLSFHLFAFAKTPPYAPKPRKTSAKPLKNPRKHHEEKCHLLEKIKKNPVYGGTRGLTPRALQPGRLKRFSCSLICIRSFLIFRCWFGNGFPWPGCGYSRRAFLYCCGLYLAAIK